jgi:hypothetical protein
MKVYVYDVEEHRFLDRVGILPRWDGLGMMKF